MPAPDFSDVRSATKRSRYDSSYPPPPTEEAVITQNSVLCGMQTATIEQWVAKDKISIDVVNVNFSKIVYR
jgi:hypothetical protein